MLAGHFGLAAAVKARRPGLPLWSLMAATQFMDIAFVVFVLAGLEGFTNAPGTNGGYGNLIISADYTHSLVGALALSLLAMIAVWVPWGRVNGLIIGAVVFSHWVLDLLVHRGDMPVLPGNALNLPRLGFGLWQIAWLSALVELAIILVGAYLYYHAAMQSAVRAERRDVKEGKQPRGYRRQALLTSVLMLVLLVGTLAGDFFVK
jgi:membrane-bound metal-dependent hydrolase YbcI (DUF457 family)